MIAGLLLLVSICGSLINFIKSVHDAQNQLQNTSLPLSVDNIYTEIQQRMIEPLLVSSLMSHDTFLRDWILGGEQDLNEIMRYLTEIQQRYDVFTTFLVSDKTKNYYHPRGLIDTINEQNSADEWYFRFRNQKEPYEINLDHNANLGDFLIMFINYKVMNYKNEMIGATGVGVRLLNIEQMLNSFKTRYKYDVYFVDEQGEIRLFSKALNKRGNIANLEGLKQLKDVIYAGNQTQFEYRDKDGEYLLNTKYIEKLKLHLFVEINKKEYMDDLKKTFYTNLIASLFVTLLVTLIILYTINVYQKQLVQLASEDSLTGLANRREFNNHFSTLMKNYQYRKGVSRMILMLIDIDDFKDVNDQYGHLIGDEVLVRIAHILKAQLRESDMVARWGGEEFAVLLSNVNKENATMIAHKILSTIKEDETLFATLQKPLTVSIGMGELSSADSQDGLTQKVDKALYAAKKNGKDQLVIV